MRPGIINFEGRKKETIKIDMNYKCISFNFWSNDLFIKSVWFERKYFRVKCFLHFFVLKKLLFS